MKIARPALSRLLVALATLGLSGCAHNALYFGTKSSVGAEVSGTTTAPTQVSLAYGRSEAAFIPAKSDGSTHSVFGSMDYDFSWTEGLALSQVFASGEAAMAVASDENITAESLANFTTAKRANGDRIDPGSNQSGRLFFATNTKVGLSLDLGQSVGQTVPSFLFGYRRDDATIIPVADSNKEVNAVFADLSVVIDREGKLRTLTGEPKREAIARDRLPASKNGVRIKQRFATGSAAILTAASTDNREKIRGDVVEAKTARDDLTQNKALRDRAKKISAPAKQDEFMTALKQARPGAADWTWSSFLSSGYTFLTAADRTALETKLPAK